MHTMASVKTWSTKEEVLKDLAIASGRKIKKNDDLDEGYLLVGDAPPPVLVEDEDDEMRLLFGDAACGKVSQTEDATPDLLGIQQMLRMMHDFNNGDDDDVGTNDATKSSDCVIAISKVSKLNPDVPEFVPKSSTSSSQSIHDYKDNTSLSNGSNNKNISDSINTNVVTQTDDVNIEDSSKKNVDVKTTDIDVDVNNIKTDEYQDIAMKLKNKISDAAKSDSFEFKKQKNVAIATLLRLYANNNKSPVKKSTEPLKLFTPEYFKGKKEDNSAVKIESVTKAPLVVSSETTSSTPEPKNSSTTIPSCSSNSISSPLQTSSDNNLQEPGNSKTIKPEVKLDPEMKRSIEKVNKWLEEPTKRKSPAVCLGPIAFKRKDTSSSKSPISDSEQKVSKSSSNGQRYQPSNYAADLGRKYMERNRIEEEKKKEVTWSNLDEILKQKDLAIEKRRREKAAASDSNDDSVSSQR